ncbi:hypothetical protein FPQ18DRAFT_236208, partial [Pyronema domesticum]
IVAVPGLGSHAFDTWKSQHGFKMWLRDFLPRDRALQNTRILLFGYRLDLKNNSSRDSIQDYARRFLIQLQHCRCRPIIFICHCFGGILIKKVCISDHGKTRSTIQLSDSLSPTHSIV